MAKSSSPHLLVIPFPAPGHMFPLLDLCYLLSTRGSVSITIVVTPGNLPTLSPLLSHSPSISPLVLPFPSSPAIPAGAENSQHLPPHLFPEFILALFSLLDPILLWSRSLPNPPVAILSDVFTAAWTLPLAESLSVPRISFSSSGAFALSAYYFLWRECPARENPKFIVPLKTLPGSPSFPLSHLSSLFRSYKEGDPVSESLRENFLADSRSWGFVINTFADLEGEYLDFMKSDLGHGRIWAVGPLAAGEVDQRSTAATKEITAWLDGCPAGSVVYVCFGSQGDLSPAQVAALAAALEMTDVRFLWSAREGTAVPAVFAGKVSGRGLVLRGWLPQVELLRHPAVGWFLTHCGWNSLLEAAAAGVAMLTWPRGADQFIGEMVVEGAGVAARLCQGREVVPEVEELARALAEAACGERKERAKAAELRRMVREAVEEGGSSFRDLENLVEELRRLAAAKKLAAGEFI